MQHESAFMLPPNLGRKRLLQIPTPMQEESATSVNQPSISAQDFQGKTVFGGFDQGFNRLALVVTMGDLLGVDLLGREGGIEMGIVTAIEALRHSFHQNGARSAS